MSAEGQQSQVKSQFIAVKGIMCNTPSGRPRFDFE